MSELDLAAIAARAAAAARGPWKYPNRNWPGVVTTPFGCLWTSGKHQGQINNDADAEFIAHARTDIPALLAEVANARAHAAAEAGEYEQMVVQRNEQADLVAEKDAEIERLTEICRSWRGENELLARMRDEARAALADVTRERDDLRARVDQVVGLAKVQAIACRAQHRADHERNWLDVLALLDTMTAEEE